MNDMSQVIIPKSDQINADSLLAGPITVTIKDVKITPGTEQPASIALEGTDKFYRPCKSMARVLVHAWGADAKAYIGRSLTLYCDPTVKWGGLAVGGIRISHMSHIASAQQMVLTATKGSRKPYTVQPLKQAPQQPATAEPETDVFGLAPIPAAPSKAEQWTEQYVSSIADCATIEDLMALQASSAKALAKLQTDKPDLHEQAVEAGSKRAQQLQESAVA